MKVDIRTPLIATALRIASPGYSTCGKCNVPWKYVPSYSVKYSNYSGTFAMCKNCWEESSLEQVLFYWEECYNDQARQGIEHGYTLEGTLMDRLNNVENDYNLNHPSRKGFILVKVQSEHYPGYTIKAFHPECELERFRKFLINRADNIVWGFFNNRAIKNPALELMGKGMRLRFTTELKKNHVEKLNPKWG